MGKINHKEQNEAYWQIEFEKMKQEYAQQALALAKMREENAMLKIENDNLNGNLRQAKDKNQALEEKMTDQAKKAANTRTYLSKITEEEHKQRKEIEQKNQEIEEQKDLIGRALEQLQQSHDELKMQRDYLEATMMELKDNNEEMEMQKVYLQSTVEELEASHKEIKKQKSFLEVTLKALRKNKAELEEKNQLVEDAFAELDRTYEDITASINYAQRIQQAMLPKERKFTEYFVEHFIIYKPRNVVSGDFYWIRTVGQKLIVVAADCTGHGVPGALMSMIGINLLDEIIDSRHVMSPDLILTELDKRIRITLDQDQTHNTDGMDIAICVIDKDNGVLEYAGAHNPLIIVQGKNTTIIKADKIGVGGVNLRQKPEFTKHEVLLQSEETTRIFMYSDGYQDQFGGPKDRKFMSRRFKELLKRHAQKPMIEQKLILEKTLTDWQGDLNQLDDILVMGLRIH